MTLVRYDAARAALEACAAVDEVKGWADEAAAVEAYARQAKDTEMRKMAVDIRMRAKRRLGELMAAQKASVGKNRGGRPRKPGTGRNPVSGPVTLAEAGIDKRLAHEARTAAALSPEAFEAAVEQKKAAIDAPDFDRSPVEPEPFDPDAELREATVEALTIINADDKLKAAMLEVVKAKRETKAATALYDALKAEVGAYKRQATSWMKKAQKSAVCKACKVALERDDE